MTFSILTATFNRAHTLPEVYASLCEQNFKDFDWLIMDDGSSDQTEQLIDKWIQENKLKIRFFKQANGGKHRAINRLISISESKFSLVLDSDDTLTPDALELLFKTWNDIPAHERGKFSGVSAQCMTRSGKWLGKPLPSETLDSNSLEIAYVHKLNGDRKGFIRTDILRQYPFPEFEGEKFLTESIVWQRIGFQYKTRYLNRVVCITDYLEDGLTANQAKLLRRNPKGTAAYYQNTLMAPIKLPFKIQAGLHIYFVRYALHAGYSIASILKGGRRKPFFLCMGLVAGPAFYLRDRYQDYRDRKDSSSAKPLSKNLST